VFLVLPKPYQDESHLNDQALLHLSRKTRCPKVVALATRSHPPFICRPLALALGAHIMALVIAIVALVTTSLAGLHTPDKTFGVATKATLVPVDAIVFSLQPVHRTVGLEASRAALESLVHVRAIEPDMHVIPTLTTGGLFAEQVDTNRVANVAELVVLTWDVIAALAIDVVCSHRIWQNVRKNLAAVGCSALETYRGYRQQSR
jgi:hypothetical protein